MNISPLKTWTVLFCLSLLACSEEKSNSKASDEDANVEPGHVLPILPRFEPTGGWSMGEELEPAEFCDIYLSADAFIFGSIVSIGMIEEPFAIIDPQTNIPTTENLAESLDQCFSVSPALKIDIEAEKFFSNYEIEKPQIVSLYIGYRSFESIVPQPIPDIEWINNGMRLKSPALTWQGETCGKDQSCSLDIGHQLGFFANIYIDEKDNRIWYLSDNVFWANSQSFVNDEQLSTYFSNVQNKLSLTDIQTGVEGCKDQVSEVAAFRRNFNRQDFVMSHVLPRCTPK